MGVRRARIAVFRQKRNAILGIVGAMIKAEKWFWYHFKDNKIRKKTVKTRIDLDFYNKSYSIFCNAEPFSPNNVIWVYTSIVKFVVKFEKKFWHILKELLSFVGMQVIWSKSCKYVKSYGFFNIKCHNFIGQASISMEPSPACSLRGSVQQAMTMDGVLSPFK